MYFFPKIQNSFSLLFDTTNKTRQYIFQNKNIENNTEFLNLWVPKNYPIVLSDELRKQELYLDWSVLKSNNRFVWSYSGHDYSSTELEFTTRFFCTNLNLQGNFFNTYINDFAKGHGYSNKLMHFKNWQFLKFIYPSIRDFTKQQLDKRNLDKFTYFSQNFSYHNCDKFVGSDIIYLVDDDKKLKFRVINYHNLGITGKF